MKSVVSPQGRFAILGCLTALALGCAHTTATVAPEQQWADSQHRACTQGSASACVELARTYVLGMPVARDEAKAATYFQLACNLKDASSCVHLAQLYEWGRGVEQDCTRARHLYETQCLQGDEGACIEAQRMHRLHNLVESPQPVKQESPTEGGLPRGLMLDIVDAHQLEIQYCYQRQLSQQPWLSGRLTVTFEIGPEGSITASAVEGDELGSAEMQQCVLEQVRKWRFPPPKGGKNVRVTFPWIFEPRTRAER